MKIWILVHLAICLFKRRLLNAKYISPNRISVKVTTTNPAKYQTGKYDWSAELVFNLHVLYTL
jgi:hypothetical protein